MSTGMVIDGVLGSEAIDSSGEILSVEGADISDWEKGTLLLNYEHQPGEQGADTIVGKVVYAKKIYKESDCENDRQRSYWRKLKVPLIYGVCRLFDGAGHENAKALAAIIRDNAANGEDLVVRFSVEGSTLDKKDNRLLESVIRRVALTCRPCNRTAVSGLIEDPDAPEGFEKKHSREKTKDLLDFEPTEKFEHPLYARLGGGVDVECNPLLENFSKGESSLDPSLGYRFEVKHGALDGSQYSWVRAYPPSPSYVGQHVGAAEFYHHPDGTHMTANSVEVHDDHQRQGIASHMYGLVEKETGKDIVPSDNQTPAGQMFWSSRKIHKAISAGQMGGAPSALTGGAALQREDLRRKAVKAIQDYSAPSFKKEEFRAHLKHELPEASDEFLDHFEDIAEDYHVRRKLAKKEATAPKELKVPKAAKPAAVNEDEADTAAVKIKQGTIRGVPTEPIKMRGYKFDEEKGILHTPKGSFPLYNPDKGFGIKEHKGAKKPFYKNGVLHVAPGTDTAKIGNPANPGFREIYQSKPIEDFHSGKVMPNWMRVHELTKAGKLPEQVIMHSAIFSMLSPNTPVRPHELMYAHMADSWEDLGIDPRDPDFKKARKHWLGKDQGTNYPRIAREYFQGHKDVHLSNDSEGKGRKAGELMSFMLAENKFKNISQYHQLHQTLADMVRRHGADARGATAELMQLKHKQELWKQTRRTAVTKIKEHASTNLGLKDHATEHFREKEAEAKKDKKIDDRNGTQLRQKWRAEAEKLGLKNDLSNYAEEQISRHPEYGEYKGVAIPGLAPKTGRFTFSMLGGGNSFVPDTHMVRHLFGMDADKDSDSLAYLKSVLWNSSNHHILEGVDRWYSKNHPAPQLMQQHPTWGQHFAKDPEQATFPAFWRHWCAIAADERARGMANTASNEFSTHEPFWEGISQHVKKSEEGETHHQLLPKMVAVAQVHEEHGEIPAQMMFFAHVIPHLLADNDQRARTNKLQGLSVDLNHALSQMRGPKQDNDLAAYTPEVHAVDVKVGSGVHPAGRVLVHNGQIRHLEDYHGLLSRVLPAGPMDENSASRLYAMSSNPSLVVRRDAPQPESPQDEAAAAAAAQQPQASAVRPPSVFQYQRAGMDHPHTLEVQGGVYLLDGKQLEDHEVKTILDNVRQGAGTIRYVSNGTTARIQKMETTITDLLKTMEDQSDEQRGHLQEALTALRHAVAAGHIDPKHERAMTKFLYEDRMTPGMGNKDAASEFLGRKKPGVYIQLDGNDFREINNRHGHAAGDAAIQSFGKYAREAMDEAVGRTSGKLFRNPDEQNLYRNGGDEFLAYVPSHEHAAKFARALSQKLEAHPPIGGTHKLSMSFGFGLDPHSADAALYKAKEQKNHEGTTTRKYPVGQVPNLAHSNVPGFEGPIPTAQPGTAAVQHVMSDPEVHSPKPSITAPAAA